MSLSDLPGALGDPKATPNPSGVEHPVLLGFRLFFDQFKNPKTQTHENPIDACPLHTIDFFYPRQ
ncbi:hypothetical protein GCM10027454_16200 [Algoriphagus aestuariicola]